MLALDLDQLHRAMSAYSQHLEDIRTQAPGESAEQQLARWSAGGHWRAYHYECQAEDDDDGYAIELAKLRTHRNLVAWTAHLMAKKWFPFTDWRAVLTHFTPEHV